MCWSPGMERGQMWGSWQLLNPLNFLMNAKLDYQKLSHCLRKYFLLTAHYSPKLCPKLTPKYILGVTSMRFNGINLCLEYLAVVAHQLPWSLGNREQLYIALHDCHDTLLPLLLVVGNVSNHSEKRNHVLVALHLHLLPLSKVLELIFERPRTVGQDQVITLGLIFLPGQHNTCSQ